ncbi:MAG: DEAD/DEAH box helicase [Candidatus Aenigmarchaeota archaeon]|nr:DEAD/DEAH box helicase [Candidatus Aenigmarchaeota archaeon]
MVMDKFKKLGIRDDLLVILKEAEITVPTEIQEKTIPMALKGQDIIAASYTGSGKTLAFGLPMIESIEKGKGLQGLVLTPTRELANQVSETLKKFAKAKKLKVASIYGGVSFDPQVKALESAEIAVATPGRMLDHIDRGTVDLREVFILVLDEADLMLDMGFLPDVEDIIYECPEDRQTMLFSATMPYEIEGLSKRFLCEPTRISAGDYVDPKKLKQIYYDVYPDNLKFSLLAHLLKEEHPGLVMIFCNTRRNVDFVSENLKALGIEALPIHGGFTQNKRDTVMEKFHSKKVGVLVCTDVAARGLDVKGVSHVYNYDSPKDAKEYVHRAGRTARAGKEGMVINLVSGRDTDNFRQVLKEYEFEIAETKMPYVERIRSIRTGDQRGGRFDSRGGRFGGKDQGYRSEGGRPGDDRGSRGGSYGRSSYGDRSGPRGGFSSGRSGGNPVGFRPSGNGGPRTGGKRTFRQGGEARAPPEIKRGKARRPTHQKRVYRGRK